MKKRKTQKVKLSDEQIQAIREIAIRRLDQASMRQLIIAYLQSQGDSIANEPADVLKAFMYLFIDYVITHGTTDQGLTGETDKETYERVKELIKDISGFLDCQEEMRKSLSQQKLAYVKFFIIPRLVNLEKTWSKKKGIAFEEIHGNPDRLREILLDEALELAPKLYTQISTVASLGVRGQPSWLPPEALPRFRRADIDGARRER